MPDLDFQKPLELHETAMKEFPVDFPDGKILFSKFPGRRNALRAVIVQIVLPNRFKKPSLYIDDAFVCFMLRPDEKIPRHSEVRFIRLWYDNDIEVRRFQLGDVWELILTDEGELINLWPSGSPVQYSGR
jgi:hypothetical protein